MTNVNLYPSIPGNATPAVSNPWPVRSSRGELDLRSEFHDFLFGSGLETAKGRLFILRRPRHDTEGKLIKCPCVDPITQESDQDTPCRYCWGEGFLWDEQWITMYKMLIYPRVGASRKTEPLVAGISYSPMAYFYCEYQIEPTRKDKIIEIDTNVEGQVREYKRLAKYRIITPEPFCSDSGRVEYWRLGTVVDIVKSAWENPEE